MVIADTYRSNLDIFNNIVPLQVYLNIRLTGVKSILLMNVLLKQYNLFKRSNTTKIAPVERLHNLQFRRVRHKHFLCFSN
jgi:hypothetical protein